MIQIRNPRNVTQLPGFTEGHFTIQDITASKPVRMLMYCRFPISECRFSNRKSKIENCKFLDLCAAPGTKTTQLAEVTGDSARIIATDIDNRRLEMVRENIARLGIKSVDIVLYEELLGITDYRLPNADFQIENSFDCVLLDVPCSNTGVLAKRVEVRYRIEPKVIRELAHLQSKLLRIAAEMVKPGGKICYSTCSIERPENNELIETFLVENQNFALESQQLMLPMAEGFDHDGGYVAILAKRETQD